MTHPLTMYITAHTVLDTMRDPARCDKAMARLRETGFGRVVIEGYRGGCIVDETTMRETRDAFRDDGFETLGGLMPVRGGDFGPPAEGA